MATILGIDVAWDRPTVQQIKATGAQWIARYLSPDASKNLTASEVVGYPAAGLAIVTVWESTAARALQGFYAGQQDAQAAEVQRKALGLPADHVHHFAVDTDTDWVSVWPYFQGALSVLPVARVGAYGGIKVINGAAGQGIKYLWQTTAWSAGSWSPHATIRQTGGTLLAGAADIDYAEVLDFGQTPRPENTVILTADDINAIWAHTETNRASGQPVRMGTVLAWSDYERQQEVTALTAQIGALTGALTALSTAVTAGGGLTAEQVTAAAQAGAAALLTQLGHTLDGTK